MKVNICDICRANNKLGYGLYRLRIKTEAMSISIDLCKKHKDWAKGKTHEQAMQAYFELTNKPQLRMDLLFEEKK